MSWRITHPPEYYLNLGGNEPAPPSTRFAPNFNGVSQLAEYPGKLIDVGNLAGLVVEGYFGAGDGTLYSQSTSSSPNSREFQIYTQTTGIVLVCGGASNGLTISTPFNGGLVRFEFNSNTSVSTYIDGSLVGSESITIGAVREPDALFRVGARGDGSQSSYGFFKSGITYNHTVGDAVFKFDDGWNNNPIAANSGVGLDMEFKNLTQASWEEIPA